MLVAKKERFDYYDLPQVRSKELPRLKRVTRINPSTKTGYCFVAVLILVLAFLLTAKHAQIDSVGYEIIALKKQQQALVLENHALQARVDQLNSLDHIEYIAVARLGMQKPETAEGVQFVPVEYSKAGSNKAGAVLAGDTKKEIQPQQKRNSLVQTLASIING